MDGVILVNKEKNWSSFDVCAFVRRKFNIKKVGHIGTLDPFAEGLLVVFLGKGTKMIPYFEGLNKEYVGTLTLGKKTSTYDLTGETIEEKDIVPFTKEELISALNSFLGEQEQLPPIYSAIKKDGKPLYYYAREGISIEVKKRLVNIYSLDLISFEKNSITFKVKVSKGTYIRSLGNDLAIKLNNLGYLSSLTRTKIGDFTLSQSKHIKEINEEDIISLDKIWNHGIYNIDDSLLSKVKNGNKLKISKDQIDDDLILIKNKDEILAIYKKEQSLNEFNFYKIERGMW